LYGVNLCDRRSCDEAGSVAIDSPTVVATPTPSFHWPVRVYYEDTDAGGIVYYANFLKFFERCRTEWLRALGIEQHRLRADEELQFVVVHASIDYLQPARLDDALAIRAEIAQLGRSFIVFAQKALRGDELLATATVKVACLNARTRAPARLPAALATTLRNESPPR